MEQLNSQNNHEDKGILKNIFIWGRDTYQQGADKFTNYFKGNNGKYKNVLPDVSVDVLNEILKEYGQEPLAPKKKHFYKTVFNGLLGNNGNGKKKKEIAAQQDYPLAQPSLREKPFIFEDRMPFEEELLNFAPEKLDEEILELVPEKPRRKHHTDKYILNDDLKNALKGEDTESAAKYFMKIKGVGYKTAAKLLGEVGKSADEKQLRKWYKAVKNKEYETVEEFSHKYSLMLDELYESEIEDCGGKAYPEIMRIDEEILHDEAFMFENGETDIYNPTEILAKGIMSVKGIKPKKVGKLLTKYYEKIGKEVDFDESQLKRWYEELMKENDGQYQFKNLIDWARYAVKLHGTPEISSEKKGHWVRKRKSKWQHYRPWAPLLIPAAVMVFSADIALNNKVSNKALNLIGLKQPAYTEVYVQGNPFDNLNSLKTESGVPAAKPAGDVKKGIQKHIVERGQSLWTISQKYYGQGNRWPEIREKNKLKYPRLVNNPDHIEPGWQLEI